MSRPFTPTSVPCVTAAAVLQRGSAEDAASDPAVVIDLRSPAEFAEDHLPGAHNVPLFDDVGRAIVGTLYKRESPEAAFAEGRRRAGERIAQLTRDVAGLTGWSPPDDDLTQRVTEMTESGIEALGEALETRHAELSSRPVVLHCWRGGLRSRSVVAFLRALGLERAVGLVGGYKAYRALVLEQLAAWDSPPSFVLRGLTGVGKTLVLTELERLRPGWTVDLEGLAGHRSSILGMVGREPCSQKTFDTRLTARLRSGFPGPVVFEGESRKIGDAILHERVWSALRGGVNFELTAPLERRVAVLKADYLVTDACRTELRGQLPFIEQRLGPRKWDGVLTGLLDADRVDELVELLLEHYYDPLYQHSETDRAYAARIDTCDPERAAAEIAAWIETR